MLGNRPCSVANCEDKQSKRHQFPDFNINPVLFKKWMDACANKELNSLDVHQIRRNRKICHKHFSIEFLMAKGRLSRNAFPTLFLPQPLCTYGKSGQMYCFFVDFFLNDLYLQFVDLMCNDYFCVFSR